jgi:hypothetical protein
VTETAERIARAFHEAYERLAPAHGYDTKPESACAWEDVPANNRALMVAVAQELLERGVIRRPQMSLVEIQATFGDLVGESRTGAPDLSQAADS